jgi:hypothetical protein
MEADFFDDINETERLAKRFIQHHSIRECILYYTNYKLSDMVASAEDKKEELMMHMDDMIEFSNELLYKLEQWENYSLCHKVKEKAAQFNQEFMQILEHLDKVDKYK